MDPPTTITKEQVRVKRIDQPTTPAMSPADIAAHQAAIARLERPLTPAATQ